MILYKIGDIFAMLPLLCFLAFLLWKFRQKKDLKRINLIMPAIICIALYWLTNGMIAVVMQRFKNVLPEEQWCYAKYILENNIYNLILYCMFIFYKIFQERKNRERLMLLMILSCIFAVAQIVFYHYLFLVNIHNLTQEMAGMVTICNVMILFVYGATLMLMERMIQNQHRQNEEEKRILSEKYEHDYYILAKEQSESVKQISKDMQRQLETVQRLIRGQNIEDRNQAENMLRKMEKEVGHIGRIYYCEDPVLNTMLSLKQEEAKRLGIEMEIEVDSVVKTQADDIDLCCIVTNLLDNAIESMQRVKEGENYREDEKISVHIGRRGGYLAMKIENLAIALPSKNKKGFYKSTKKSGKFGEHGRGLGIIEKTIKKYDGYMDMRQEEDKVITAVFLREE